MKALIKTGFLVVIVFVSCSIFWFLPLNYNHHLAAMVNKLEYLKKTGSPKIVLVGGSGLYGGIDSPMLEKETGLNVVNMGLFRGFGSLSSQDIIRPYLKKNDIVILFYEYPLLFAFQEPDSSVLGWLYLLVPELMKKHLCSIKGIQHLSDELRGILSVKAEALIMNIATLNFSHMFEHGMRNYHKEVNRHGDYIKKNHDGEIFKKSSLDDLKKQGMQYKALSEQEIKLKFKSLREFNEYARSIGTRVCMVPHPCPVDEWVRFENEIRSLYRVLSAYTSIPLLGNPADFVYEYDFFLDTIYHVDSRGKKRKTDSLIKLLKSGPLADKKNNG
jgi:hypothetical protein